MLRRTLLAFVVYTFGAIGLLYWSVAGFDAGAPREDWALMIVLPAAWIISFWPMFGTLVMIRKIWSVQGLLERIGERIEADGAADAKDLTELEDIGARLAATESRLPEFIVRPFVRKALARIATDQTAAREAKTG
jgi:hypothetical protein